MMKEKFQSRSVVTISVAHLLHDTFSAFLAPLLPLLIEKLGISYTLAGALNVINRVPMLLNPFFGLLADKIHMRFLVIFTPMITAITASLFGAAPNFTFLAILVFVMGLSAALFHVPSPVMIRKVSGKYIGRGMSFYMFGGEVARTIGPLVILGAVSAWGLENTWYMIPVSVGFTVYLYYALKDIHISEEFREKKEEHNAGITLRKYTPFLLMLSGLMAFRSLLKSAVTAFLPTYLTDQGETVWFGGIALVTLEAAGAIGTLLAGTLSDRIGRKRTLVVASVLSPVIFWFFIQASPAMQFPMLMILGFFLFASGPVLLAMVQDLGSERPAFINGIYMTINFFFGSLTVMLVGFLGDEIGLKLTYEIIAFASLFAIPFAVFIFRYTKSKS
jgi:FSR family fosmidomycin resistance protein-like MFS transporter